MEIQCPRRRDRQRRHCLFIDDATVIDCVLRDRSRTGAKLKYSDWFDYPRRVSLRIGTEKRRECEVVRFANTIMGVRYIDPDPKEQI